MARRRVEKSLSSEASEDDHQNRVIENIHDQECKTRMEKLQEGYEERGEKFHYGNDDYKITLPLFSLKAIARLQSWSQ